ncbi:MAG: DNA repair protein RecO [Ruminococcaceae bacterium]|nr:DNA repair protein RecO [Oscillospiraceae bacterium]
MQITTDALVIKVSDVGENDRLITLLTKDYGVLKAFASQAKKIKSKYYAGTALFSYSRFILEYVKGTYRVRDASLTNSFFKVGCDVTEISLQQYFCELSSVLAPIDGNAETYLRLLLNSMYCLNNNKMNESLLKAIFELRILTLSGYSPDLIACDGCGEFDKDIFYFNLFDGVVLCDDCVTDKNATVILDKTLFSAMRHIIYCDFEKLFSFSIPDDKANRLSKITEKFLLTQTEQRFSTLDFYNSIL